MYTSSQQRLEDVLGFNASELKKDWGWLLAWGIVTILAGWLMLSNLFIASVVTVLFVGVAAVIGGISEIVYAFHSRRQKGFPWMMLWGALSVIAGVLICLNPVVGTVTLTMVIAAYLVVGGIGKLLAASRIKMVGRGWLIFNGLVNLALAFVLFAGWPGTGLFAPGLFVGIDFIMYGVWIAMFAFAVRNAPSGLGHGVPAHS